MPAESSRRGRPPGARTRVLREQAALLGAHHFAFLRSWFQGLDVRDAWQRYLAFSEPGHDLRRIERRRAALLRQVLDAGHQIDLTLPAGQRISRQLDLLAQPPRAAALTLPSLDEFIAAQGLDREFYSEAELLQEYRQHHHLDAVPEAALPDPGGSAGARAQVRALHQLEVLLARAPMPSDRLALWLSPALARRLEHAGLATLTQLADALRSGDAGWFRRVPGLGQTQAHALAQWLAPLAASLGQAIPVADLVATSAQRAERAARRRDAARQPQFGLVPLERLAPPTPAARDELQTIRTWLSGQAAPATRRAYTKEAERFFLWCLHVRQRPLHSLGTDDLAAYAGFVSAPPSEWLQPLPVPRSDAAWRPFRKALGASSCRHALTVVRSLLASLAAAGQWPGQASAAVQAVTAPLRATPRQIRALTHAEWCFLQERLAAEMAACEERAGQRGAAELRRLRLILALLARTGWRLSQLAGATLGGSTGQVFAADPQLAQWLQAHHRDAERIAALPQPAPLVCSLGERPRRWLAEASAAPGSDGDGGGGVARTGQGPAVALEAARPPQVRALSATGIDLTLKRFFRRAASHAEAAGVSPQRLLGASAHWARNAARHECSTVEQAVDAGGSARSRPGQPR